MTAHRLRASQTVDRPIEEVFDFFSRPRNLARITPPAMGFEQVSTHVDMRAGLEIEHRIRPLFGIPLGWRSRIESYDPPASFVDVQAAGPYRSWEHRHSFISVAGGTRIEDEVVYELPLGPLGSIAHAHQARGGAAGAAAGATADPRCRQLHQPAGDGRPRAAPSSACHGA